MLISESETPKVWSAMSACCGHSVVIVNEPSPKNHEAAAAAQIFWNGSAGIMNVEPAKSAFQSIVAQETNSWGEQLNGGRHHFNLMARLS